MIYRSECGRYTIENNFAGTLYRKDGKIHRDGDLPAVVYADGGKEYWKDGKIHRDGDLPAVEYWKDGKIHRDGDLPAVVYADGRKVWYKDGERHRDGDLPAVEWHNGIKEYWKNGVQYNPFEKIKIKTGDTLIVVYEGKDREIEKGKVVSLKCKIKEK